MNPWLSAAAVMYALLGLAHSWLGERKVVAPLLRAPWQIGLPRGFAAPLVRWAWHLTSLAWAAAAAILGWAAAGGSVSPVVIDTLAALALVSGAIIGVGLRGTHFAWPLFTAAGLACLVGAHGWPGPAARAAAGAVAAAVLVALAALHVYWLAGGRRGLGVVVPSRADGTPLFAPPPAATVAVAVLLVAAAAIVASAAGVAPRLPFARPLGLVVGAVFAARMIGDFRVAGLFKRERRTAFARWDSMLFSPLCAALSVSCALAAA